jgi:prepilin-type N-terminal cleavage/methylation domain-containing protein/prepilin-type processing-associated H-X9-DG protein
MTKAAFRGSVSEPPLAVPPSPSSVSRARISTRRFRQGFSLLEILVVASILGILLALSMPAFSKIKDSGAQATCVSNLRTLHRAVMTFASDNDGCIPTANGGPAENDVKLAQFLSDLPSYVLGTTNANQAVTERITPFTCPAALRERKGDRPAATYGYNSSLYSGTGNTRRMLRMVQVKSPSRTVLLMDGRNAWEEREAPPSAYWFFEVGPGNARRPTGRDFAHRSKANAVFLDGHVENLVEAQIPTTQNDPFWSPAEAP